MDEVEIDRAFKNLRTLIDHITNTEVQNALLTVTAIMHAMNQRMDDLIADADDE